LRIKRLVFGDLGPIQNFEPVTLEHLLTAPAFESDDLPVNTFFAAAIEITQIRAHQRARGGHFSRLGKKIDVKMRNTPRGGRHFPPTVHQNPANKATRSRIVTEIPGERFQEKRNVLPKRVKLIAKRFARAE